MFSNLRSLIFKLDPEKAHTLAIKSLKFNLVPNLFQDKKMIICLKQHYLAKISKTQLEWLQVLIKMLRSIISYSN